MLTVNMLSPHQRRMFSSVFPTVTHTTPTPEVSPYIGAPASPNLQDTETTTIADELAQQTVAWSVVTRWLSVDNSQISTSDGLEPPGLDNALYFLLHQQRTAAVWARRDLLAWYMNDVRNHFDASVRPQLAELWKSDVKCRDVQGVLTKTVEILHNAQTVFLTPLDGWLSTHDTKSGDQSVHFALLVSSMTAFRKAATDQTHTMVLQSLPSTSLLSSVAYLLHQVLSSWSSVRTPTRHHSSVDPSFLVKLSQVGLGQDLGQKALAHAVKAAITTYTISYEMRVDWIGRKSVAGILQTWVEHHLEPAITRCLHLLTGDSSLTFTQSEKKQWHFMALDSLGRLRIKNLLRYVQSWNHSLGAVLDIKEYLRTAEAKNHLAASFASQMQAKILHPGVKTSDLLSIYINMIHVFKTLDNRGVLLEKVAHPLRAYLRQREDTVKVIAASFLADVDDDGKVNDTSDDVCSDIPLEVVRSEEEDVRAAEKALDWDDMEWMPDPMDAGPDFKKSKGNDIISYIITLFEQDDFIKEVQTILGERLLRSEDADLEKEIRLVELFKSRLGQDKLQTCEVMLRDMQDSARIMSTMRSSKIVTPTAEEIYEEIGEDGVVFQALAQKFRRRIPATENGLQNFMVTVQSVAIRDPANGLYHRNPSFRPRPAPTDAKVPKFHAQILSSFFWPALREDDFSVPAPIRDLKEAFAQDFERIKNLRRLHWLSGLGRATVQLELEDRTVEVADVHTWQASVIYAFQTSSADVAGGDQDMTDADVEAPVVSLTVTQLMEQLEMDDLLVRNAVGFWVSQRVLVETDPDTYVVLERLPSAEEEDEAARVGSPAKTQAVAPTISAVKSQNAILMDNKDMYQVFIIGMLTNGGNMDAGRVEMMMKMVMPGGFAFGVEEVKVLLDDLVGQERVVEVGGSGVYGIRK